MSTEPTWGELDVLHPLLVRAVQCSESLMTQLQKARDQAAIAGLAVRLIDIPIRPGYTAQHRHVRFRPAWLGFSSYIEMVCCAVCCRGAQPQPPSAARDADGED
jgi:hypothetical protein